MQFGCDPLNGTFEHSGYSNKLNNNQGAIWASNMSSSSELLQFPLERRTSVRVQDAVILDFLPLPGDTTEALWPVAATLALGRVDDKYSIDGFAEVRRDFPAVSDYIDSLEESVRRLRVDQQEALTQPTHRVSLSVTGIAFADQRLLQPGDEIRLRLTLFPQLTAIECHGTVISVGVETELANGEQHTYRVTFTNLSTADRDLVDAHVTGLRRALRHTSR